MPSDIQGGEWSESRWSHAGHGSASLQHLGGWGRGIMTFRSVWASQGDSFEVSGTVELLVPALLLRPGGFCFKSFHIFIQLDLWLCSALTNFILQMAFDTILRVENDALLDRQVNSTICWCHPSNPFLVVKKGCHAISYQGEMRLEGHMDTLKFSQSSQAPQTTRNIRLGKGITHSPGLHKVVNTYRL